MRRAAGRRAGATGQGLLTILFTDIESSTAMTQRLGDVRAQEIVRAHNGIVRRALEARGGRQVKHTGDGILATFASATAAVSCAIAIQEATRQHSGGHPETGFSVRIGLNAGEPVAEEEDVFGTAVQLAARACASAEPGQIIASDVVRQLVAGKGLVFSDLGRLELKGFQEAVHLYEIGAEAEVGEQLWRDTQQQPSRPSRQRLPITIAVAALALVVVAGVAALALVLIGGGADGSRDDTVYRELHISVHARGPMDVVTGDCVSSDIVFRGTGESDIQGELSGRQSTTFESRVRASTSCQSLSIAYTNLYSLTGDDSFSLTAAGYSNNRLLGIDLEGLEGLTGVSGGANTSDAGVIFGGTGLYAGVAGKSACEAVGLRSGVVVDGKVGYESASNCVLKLAPAADLGPVTLSSVGDTLELTPQLGASGTRDTLTLSAVYHNNREFTLTGLSLRLPLPGGLRLAAVTPGATEREDGIAWPLPDLPPDGVGTFEFTVRLLDARGDELTLIPEITGAQLDQPARGDEIELSVVR